MLIGIIYFNYFPTISLPEALRQNITIILSFGLPLFSLPKDNVKEK